MFPSEKQEPTVVDKKNVAFSSLKSHTLHSRNPIQHQKQIQQAYAEKYCWIKLFEDDAAHMLSEMGNCSICRKECDFYCIIQFAYIHIAFKIKRLSKIPIDGAVCKAQHSTICIHDNCVTISFYINRCRQNVWRMHT